MSEHECVTDSSTMRAGPERPGAKRQERES